MSSSPVGNMVSDIAARFTAQSQTQSINAVTGLGDTFNRAQNWMPLGGQGRSQGGSSDNAAMPTDCFGGLRNAGNRTSSQGSASTTVLSDIMSSPRKPTTELSDASKTVVASKVAVALASGFSQGTDALPTLSKSDRQAFKAQVKESLGGASEARSGVNGEMKAVQQALGEVAKLLKSPASPISGATYDAMGAAAKMFNAIGRSDLASAVTMLMANATVDRNVSPAGSIATGGAGNAGKGVGAPDPSTTTVSGASGVSATSDGRLLTRDESKLLASTLASTLANQGTTTRGVPTAAQVDERRVAAGLPKMTTAEAATYTGLRDGLKIGYGATTVQTGVVNAAEKDIIENGNIKADYLPAMRQASALLKASGVPESVQIAASLDSVIAAASQTSSTVDEGQAQQVATQGTVAAPGRSGSVSTGSTILSNTGAELMAASMRVYQSASPTTESLQAAVDKVFSNAPPGTDRSVELARASAFAKLSESVLNKLAQNPNGPLSGTEKEVLRETATLFEKSGQSSRADVLRDAVTRTPTST